MSTDNTSIETESAATDAGNETQDVETAAPTSATPRIGVASMLTRDSDLAARKGFRSPPNAKSKAQRSEKPKKR
jgi:hypothetical protein